MASVSQSFGNFDLSEIEEWDINLTRSVGFAAVDGHDDYDIGSYDVDNPLNMKISSWLANGSLSALRQSYDELQSAFATDRKNFRQFSDRSIPAHMRTLTKRFVKSLGVMEYDVGLIADEAHFISNSRHIVTFNITSSPKTMALYNSGDYATPLIVLFAANQTTITHIVLRNSSDNFAFSYRGQNVTLNNTLIANMDIKQVRNNSTFDFANFAGDWLKLSPGTSEMLYTGTPCLLTIEYYRRFAA